MIPTAEEYITSQGWASGDQLDIGKMAGGTLNLNSMQKGKETPASELKGFGVYYSQGKDYHFHRKGSNDYKTISANNESEAWEKLAAKVAEPCEWLISR